MTSVEAGGEALVAPAAEVKRSGGRMEFLDALRGAAALLVVLHHIAEKLSSRYAVWTTVWFRPGELGVVTFFFCSGFIIPASIERHGSVLRFWIGRFFRLYPIYWAVLAAAYALKVWGSHYPFPAPTDGTAHLLLTNATMMPRMLRSPMFSGAVWSLAYEVVFYLAVTALFVAGVYRRSVRLAWVVMAITAGLAVFKVNAYTSIGKQGTHGVVWIVGVSLAIVLALAVAGRLQPMKVAGVAVLVTLSVSLMANRADALWFAMLLVSCMFVGTVLYRAVAGELPWSTAWTVFGGGLVLSVLVWWWAIVPYADPRTGTKITWYGEGLTFIAAYGVFALGLRYRDHAFPWVARELGRISYSVYLVHPIVIYSIGIVDESDVKSAAVWLAATLVVSMATYRLVEKPTIALGRAVVARLPKRPAASADGTGSTSAPAPASAG